MKLAGAITEGSGAVNEDGFGVVETAGQISAAWVLDGVTGINDQNYLPGGSDAAWLVSRALAHLHQLAKTNMPLVAILEALVNGLVADWGEVSSGISLPADYDPPAACLILAKNYPDGWKALRLGDSCLLARHDNGDRHLQAATPDNAFDHWLSMEAKQRRDAGVLDGKALLAEFRADLIASRKNRNQPGGYSILEADPAALRLPEIIGLGHPRELLLCTDGFYRAVDHYGLHDDESLLSACTAELGVAQVLSTIRAIEADDPACETYLRFKPADDATAVMLIRGS